MHHHTATVVHHPAVRIANSAAHANAPAAPAFDPERAARLATAVRNVEQTKLDLMCAEAAHRRALDTYDTELLAFAAGDGGTVRYPFGGAPQPRPGR